MIALKIFIVIITVFMSFHLLIGLDRMTSSKSKAPYSVTIPLFFAFVSNFAALAYCIADMIPEMLIATFCGYLSISIYMAALYFDDIEISKIYRGRNDRDK